MSKQPRRNFLTSLGTATAAMALAAPARVAAQGDSPEFFSNPATIVIPLESWTFALDPAGAGKSQGWFKPGASSPKDAAPVTVPHTWQVAGPTAGYLGRAWYWTEFDAQPGWSAGWVRVEFEAAFHSARVWLNGKDLGEHLGSGYTSFILDATPALRWHGRNLLVVEVDNSPGDGMLPRNESYDWTSDGGLIRPVSLFVTPEVFIDHVGVTAAPDLDSGHSAVNVQAHIRNVGVAPQKLTASYSIVDDPSGMILATGAKASEISINADGAQAIELAPTQAPLKLWHFDHPNLYRVVVTLASGGTTLHTSTSVFGSRRFEAKGTAFYLNGERVRLMGVERMAGSNPRFGMAEPAPWIEHDHHDLKELNCVFTRVHWQQDRRVLDYCDRHGILLQEEVPAWGHATFKGMEHEPSPQIMTSGLEQLRETIRQHGNHPSIISWGLCNEVDGKNPVAREFIRRMASEARRLDAHRPLTYAADSLYKDPGSDAAGLLDFISFNEYYGSWTPGNAESLRQSLPAIHAAFPAKPVVISEYGFCECRANGPTGDAQRIAVLREHTQVCRDFDFVAGTIFFDYNDYRTHMGDKGTGPLKQRVHGVVDLLGNRKPSFEALRGEASPVESLQIVADGDAVSASVTTRSSLPAYTLEGYTLRWLVFGFDDLPMEEGSAALAKLAPGGHSTVRISFEEKHPTRVQVDVMRPTGFSALTTVWRPPQ